MKIRQLLLLTLIVGLPINSWGADLFVGDRASNYTLKSNQGENLRLSEQRGRVILMAFWSGWCGICKQQLKGLEALHLKHKEKGFQVWGVSLDQDMKEVDYHTKKLGLSFPVLYDVEHKVSQAYKVDELPFVVLIDRDGIIRYVKEDFKTKYLKEYHHQVNLIVNE